MHQKAYPVQIWFLDNNLAESAKALTNKHLNATIQGCYCALVSARLYFAGIRSPKFYKHYFSKELIYETLDKHFPAWPLRSAPPFKRFTSRETKWCRQCMEHYEHVRRYMEACLDEYAVRFKREHDLQEFIMWEKSAPIPRIPYANLKKIVLPWKNISPRYRCKDIVESYRKQYKAAIGHPLDAYQDTPRDVPSWIIGDYMLET